MDLATPPPTPELVPGKSFGFDPRRLRDERLADCLRRCLPGSDSHMALLREQRRRREIQAKIAAVAPPPMPDPSFDPWESARP